MCLTYPFFKLELKEEARGLGTTSKIWHNPWGYNINWLDPTRSKTGEDSASRRSWTSLHALCNIFMCAKSIHSWLILCDPMVCNQLASVHGILHAKILEWVAMSSSRGSSRPRDQTQVSYFSCLGRRFFTTITTWEAIVIHSVQFSSVQLLSHVRLYDPMNRSMPSLPVHHQLPEFTQIHVHQVSDTIQPSHPLSSPSPPAPNPSQHQGLFQWVNSSNEVAKVLEFQLQHQSFKWTPRTDLL